MAADSTVSSHTSKPTSVHSSGQEETSSVVNSTTISSCSPFPRVQSPVVTLLQKRRDGTIPKGAIYMLGVMSHEEAKNRKHYEQDSTDGQTENKSNSELLCSENQEYKHENVHTRQSASECKVREESSFVQRQCKNLEQILEAKQPQHSRQPMRIEDYEPGQCSAVDALPVESQYYNPPIDKPGQNCLYTDNSQGFQWQIRKHGPMSPTQSELSVHELYRKIQKGGHIPEHGLQMTIAEFRKGHSLPMSFHVRDSLSKTQLIDGHASPRTRQQRDLENAMRHMRLERIVAEEKLKRLAQQHRENLARRHSDFFTPLQKAPVSLSRYDDDMEAAASTSAFRHSLRNKSSNVRGKARALYTFRAQSDRELSFRKGDYLYLLRQVDKNWFLGERHGLRGIFPVSYVEVVVSLEEARGLASQREGLGRALFDFVAQSSAELSLRKGETLKLIRLVDANWYEGRIGRRHGIVPVSYVETLVEPDLTVMTPLTSRNVTPMPGYSRPMSPCGSIVSQSIAPTVPSAPMSPVDSEWMDDSLFGSREEFNPRSLTSTPLPPFVNTDVQSWDVNFADNVKNLASSYHFDDSSQLYLSANGSTGRGYGEDLSRFGNSSKIYGSATWSPQSSRDDNVSYPLKNLSSTSYTQLRYPPYRVQYSYQPCNADELELEAGDIVYVVETCEDGWFVGTCERTQEFGTFPGNYVQRIR